MNEPQQPGDEQPDPTRVTNQPSLTTSTGRIWLVVGGLFALIAAFMLVLLLPLSRGGVAQWALGLVVLLYVAMVVVQLLTHRGRLRLGLQAGLMIAIAVVALASILIIAAGQISPANG